MKTKDISVFHTKDFIGKLIRVGPKKPQGFREITIQNERYQIRNTRVQIEQAVTDEPTSMKELMNQDRVSISELISLGKETHNQGKQFTCRAKFVKIYGNQWSYKSWENCTYKHVDKGSEPFCTNCETTYKTPQDSKKKKHSSCKAGLLTQLAPATCAVYGTLLLGGGLFAYSRSGSKGSLLGGASGGALMAATQMIPNHKRLEPNWIAEEGDQDGGGQNSFDAKNSLRESSSLLQVGLVRFGDQRYADHIFSNQYNTPPPCLMFLVRLSLGLTAYYLMQSPETKSIGDALGFGSALLFSSVFVIRLVASRKLIPAGPLLGLSVGALVVFVSAYMQDKI
ncbi:hypothetical protein IFM89_002501 [Coptis chinensis]|uniref:Uncharacterized protein n=1 Tax=Coptis chinensis TaxID=261450 RepID=A0A835HNB4_9MAGN|nr:hypothetical protein IFM89_002501 [Coptis chinensis]